MLTLLFQQGGGLATSDQPSFGVLGYGTSGPSRARSASGARGSRQEQADRDDVVLGALPAAPNLAATETTPKSWSSEPNALEIGSKASLLAMLASMQTNLQAQKPEQIIVPGLPVDEDAAILLLLLSH